MKGREFAVLVGMCRDSKPAVRAMLEDYIGCADSADRETVDQMMAMSPRALAEALVELGAGVDDVREYQREAENIKEFK